MGRLNLLIAKFITVERWSWSQQQEVIEVLSTIRYPGYLRIWYARLVHF